MRVPGRMYFYIIVIGYFVHTSGDKQNRPTPKSSPKRLSIGQRILSRIIPWRLPTKQPDFIPEKLSLFEGDIIQTEQIIRRNDGGYDSTKDISTMVGLFRRAFRWPNGVVPIVMENSYSRRERLLIARAIGVIESVSCVRFVPYTGQKSYVYIHKGKHCASAVGRQGGGQALSLNNKCLRLGIILHELMHVLGFWHEHSRSDRGDYIDIHWANIHPLEVNNFLINPSYKISDVGLPYDYDSILHYGSYTFARDRYHPTITAKKDNVKIGRRHKLSKLNIEAINRYYKCQEQVAKPRAIAPYQRAHSVSCLDVHWACGMARTLGWCVIGRAATRKYCRRSCGFCRPIRTFGREIQALMVR